MNFQPAQLYREIQTLQQRVSDLQLQQVNLQENVNNIGETAAALENKPPVRGQIDNLLRNSKLRHSWDTWTNETPVAGNEQEECALIFTSKPDDSVQIFTGSIAAASDVLTIGAEIPFVDPSDETLEIIIEGAGADGADLSTTIETVNSPTEAVLADAAATTVSSARVRFRLLTLPKTSTKTGTIEINAALKNSAHTHFSDPQNISSPAWDKSNGNAVFGSKNTINFPLGYWNRTTESFVFQNLIEPSKTYYFICKLARKNATIRPKGFLYASLVDNSEGKRKVIEGGRFELSARVVGTPAATVSSQYKIIARTDQGKTLESNIFTILRPADSSFITNAVYVHLSWSNIPGVRIFEVWRKTGGVFEKLEEITNSTRIYLDQNAVKATGSSFPNGDLQRRRAEGFTRPDDLKTLAINGNSSGWDFAEIPISVPASYDLRSTTEQWLVAGLTEIPDREMTDCVCSTGSTLIESNTAEFSAGDIGLSVVLRSGNNTFTGTISDVSDASHAELSAPAGFDASTGTLLIEKGGADGILIGEFGLSLTPGTWAANHDDNQTAQSPASNPNGSTTGGNNPNGGDVEYPGGVLCVRSDMKIRLFSASREINELPINLVETGNSVDGGSIRPNIVLKKSSGRAECLLEIKAAGKTVFATPNHPFFRNFDNFDAPVPAHLFRKGDAIAMNIGGVDLLGEIEFDPVPHFGVFDVANLDSLSPDHIFIVECFYCHNRKDDRSVLPD